MLEWYQMDLDHYALMQEVNVFLQTIFSAKPARLFTYQEIFQQYVNCCPHEATRAELICAVQENNIVLHNLDSLDSNALCDLLMVECIEPALKAFDDPVIIYNYPAAQAALARIEEQPFSVASRFEVYWKGIELGNGYHELQCARTHRERFLQDNRVRTEKGLSTIPLDQPFLAAMESPGLPNCAGVALGIDRLLMIALEQTTIDDFGFFDL
jgi:lysyl-tRNA synthetase class 2